MRQNYFNFNQHKFIIEEPAHLPALHLADACFSNIWAHLLGAFSHNNYLVFSSK